MLVLEKLKQSLQATNDQAFVGLHFDQRDIQREVKKLQVWLTSTDDQKPPVDRVNEAIQRFYTLGHLNNLNEGRLVCHGATAPIRRGAETYRLIEDADRFQSLLNCVDGFRHEPRRYRRCYRGLLASYFFYDPNGADARGDGKSDWLKLRTYLHERIENILADGVTPTWVTSIREHRNLLTAEPCTRYGRAYFFAGVDEFAQAEEQLGFSGASWVSREVVRSRVVAATELGDEEFKRHLPETMKLLGETRHASLLDEGLACLLERYSKTAPVVVDPDLRNFAIEHWKNPWLDFNGRWRRVSDSTRKMVADWLKLDLIKQFFELLSADGGGDTRRLDFWIRYVNRIDDIYFALGKYAAQNRSPSFVDLRRKLAGRQLSLSGGGKPENNAFIMRIGDYVFVEFGTAGNAAFVYRKSDGLPFDLDATKSIAVSELRGKPDREDRILERLVHKDNVHGFDRWERLFESRLYMNYAIRESEKMLPEPWSSGRWLTLASKNANNIDAFCRAYGLRTKDATAKGGYFWILADDKIEVVRKQLRSWLFGYRPDTGWWS